MNVGFISDSFPMGGIARVVTLIGDGMEKFDNNSFYLSASGDSSNFYKIPSGKLTISKYKIRETKILKYTTYIKKYTELVLNNKSVNLANYMNKQYMAISEFIKSNHLDIIIICRYDLTFLVSRLKEKFPSLKVIVWIHGPVNIYTEKKERLKYLEFYKDNLLKSDAVVCLTEYDIAALAKINVEGRKIYNPIIYEKDDDCINTERNNNILCVSRLDIESKGIDILVKLADKLPDNWNVNLIGDGTKSQIEKFQYLYSKMKYPSKINYLGPKNSDELAAYYKNSRILVSPALYEGFGLTLVEAMNFGLPVVTFETTGAMEITQNGKFGYLVKDFSENNFIKGTIDLINNEKILAEYTELALLRSNTFSLNSILQQWEELLKYVTS